MSGASRSAERIAGRDVDHTAKVVITTDGQFRRGSAVSLKELAAALLPLMDSGGAVVGLDFDATVAWPSYDWAGVSKAALESINRYLARDLGPRIAHALLPVAGKGTSDWGYAWVPVLYRDLQ